MCGVVCVCVCVWVCAVHSHVPVSEIGVLVLLLELLGAINLLLQHLQHVLVGFVDL